MAKILREEAEKTNDDRHKKICTDFADHWDKQAAFHEKYKQWGFIKSTLLFPIWILRELKFTKEIDNLHKEQAEIIRKNGDAYGNVMRG